MWRSPGAAVSRRREGSRRIAPARPELPGTSVRAADRAIVALEEAARRLNHSRDLLRDLFLDLDRIRLAYRTLDPAIADLQRQVGRLSGASRRVARQLPDLDWYRPGPQISRRHCDMRPSSRKPARYPG